jgi:hypothetical protein
LCVRAAAIRDFLFRYRRERRGETRAQLVTITSALQARGDALLPVLLAHQHQHQHDKRFYAINANAREKEKCGITAASAEAAERRCAA